LDSSYATLDLTENALGKKRIDFGRIQYMSNTIVARLLAAFNNKEFTLAQAYTTCIDEQWKEASIRARIYENIGTLFSRISRGVYKGVFDGVQCVFIHGDGRDLSMLKDNSVDCIITDHPWIDKVSHLGGSRKFANYGEGLSFNYTDEDFAEKYRVLAPGSFLVEFLPIETEANFVELYRIKAIATKYFRYYALLPYYEVNKIRNTGRQSKSGGQFLILSKGKARSLRPDQKKNYHESIENGFFMSGTSSMLPTYFSGDVKPKNEQIHKSEKSVNIIKQLISFVTKMGELILDQFAGSGAIAEACFETNRLNISIEKDERSFNRAVDQLLQYKIPVLALEYS